MRLQSIIIIRPGCIVSEPSRRLSVDACLRSVWVLLNLWRCAIWGGWGEGFHGGVSLRGCRLLGICSDSTRGKMLLVMRSHGILHARVWVHGILHRNVAISISHIGGCGGRCGDGLRIRAHATLILLIGKASRSLSSLLVLRTVRCISELT